MASWLFNMAVRHERGRDTLPRDPALHVPKNVGVEFDLSLWLGFN
jgi:hypothetical protein